MAYREVTMVEIREVLRQWLEGAGKKVIARCVGLDRNTVRSYIKVAEACGLQQRDGIAGLTDERLAEVLAALAPKPSRVHGEAWATCETHREFIVGKLKRGVRLSKVRRLLQRQGVKVSYPTLHRFAVSELEFGRGAPTIPVADCKPGEEVQVDTGWVGHLEPDEHGVRRRFRAWIFTSVYSRHRFVYPCFRERTEDAIEACEAAWAFFGGVFKVLLPDNTKAIVQLADPLEPLVTLAFQEYAQARGFHVDPARARHPKDKARVERSVQPVRDDCFAGEVLRTVEAARERGRYWCLEEYGLRRHTTTQRLPRECFEAEERACLLPAPTAPYELPLWCDPKVGRDQHAQVAKAIYSLPRDFAGERLVGRRLRARADRTTVRFYFKRQLVKIHPRQPPGGRSTDAADFPPERAATAMRDVAFIEGQAARHGVHVGQYAHALLAGPLPWTRMRRVWALVGLCRRFGDARVDATCAQALAAEMLSIKRLERMLLCGPTAAPAPTPPPAAARVIPLCRFLRPPTQYALPFARRALDSDHDDHHGGTQ